MKLSENHKKIIITISILSVVVTVIILYFKSVKKNAKVPVTELYTSNIGKNLIIQHECSGKKYAFNKPYVDAVGKWTVGVGHLMTGKELYDTGRTRTNTEVDLLFEKDILTAENIVKKYIKVNISQNQFDALVSFAFNFGEDKFSKYTLKDLINSGANKDTIHSKFLEYSKGKVNGVTKTLAGLLRRRTDEANLYIA